MAVYFAALMSSGYAQSPASQTPTKKQSIGKSALAGSTHMGCAEACDGSIGDIAGVEAANSNL
jgi:hypothetical protein